jgi:hypothetical protein
VDALVGGELFAPTTSTLRSLLLNAFTRGAITGLGLVNLLLAVLEAHEHTRETRRGA